MEKNKKLIGVSGKKRSGKDTFFDKFNDIKNGYINKKFANKIKEICYILTGVPLYYFYDGKHCDFFIKDWGMTVRELQQKIGTEIFRDNLCDDVWIKSLFSGYSDDSKWIITDVRFPNEADEILRRGGILVRINRFYSTDDTHISETALDNYNKWDYVINNDGSIEEYYLEISNFINQFKI